MEQFISIESMQCTSELGMDIDCKFISDHFPLSTKFDPSLPHKISIFIDDPKIRFTLFRRKGKMVILGGKSISDPVTACKRIVEEIQVWSSILEHQMEKVEYREPVVNNIVTTGYLGSTINLNRMAFDYDDDGAKYETEQFPGLRYKFVKGTNISASIFFSGKFILTGCKTQEQIDTSHTKLIEITRKYLHNKNAYVEWI